MYIHVIPRNASFLVLVDVSDTFVLTRMYNGNPGHFQILHVNCINAYWYLYIRGSFPLHLLLYAQ